MNNKFIELNINRNSQLYTFPLNFRDLRSRMIFFLNVSQSLLEQDWELYCLTQIMMKYLPSNLSHVIMPKIVGINNLGKRNLLSFSSGK